MQERIVGEASRPLSGAELGSQRPWVIKGTPPPPLRTAFQPFSADEFLFDLSPLKKGVFSLQAGLMSSVIKNSSFCLIQIPPAQAKSMALDVTGEI